MRAGASSRDYALMSARGDASALDLSFSLSFDDRTSGIEATGCAVRSIRWRARAGIAALAALFMVVGAAASAATVPNGFVDGIYVRVPSDTTAMQFAPDGRLFIAQQSGKLRVVPKGKRRG